MLIIPIIGKISLRNPPVVTILLILINVGIYFGFQFGDMAASLDAQQYYFESGLVEVELPRYLAFKEGHPYTDEDLAALEDMEKKSLLDLLGQSIRDGRFRRRWTTTKSSGRTILFMRNGSPYGPSFWSDSNLPFR